jgi:hypothetical protein
VSFQALAYNTPDFLMLQGIVHGTAHTTAAAGGGSGGHWGRTNKAAARGGQYHRASPDPSDDAAAVSSRGGHGVAVELVTEHRFDGDALARSYRDLARRGHLRGTRLPAKGCVFVSVKDADKPFLLEPIRLLLEAGFQAIATGGTCSYLRENGLEVESIKKVLEGRPHVLDRIKNGEVQLVFNTTEGKQSLEDSFAIRRTALMMKIPYYTTAAGALAAAQAISTAREETLEVRALQSYAFS